MQRDRRADQIGPLPRGVTGMPFSSAYLSTPLTFFRSSANTSASAVPVLRPSASLWYSGGICSAKAGAPVR